MLTPRHTTRPLTAERPAVQPSNRRLAAVALSLAVLAVAGCSSGSDGAASTASKVSETREEAERETTTTDEPRTTTTTPGSDDPAETPGGKSGAKTTTTIAGQDPGAGATDFVLPTGWVEYESSTGARIAHPAEWTVESSSAAPLVLFIDPATSQFRRNINMLIQPVGSMSLDDYVSLTADQLVDAGATVDSEGATTWSGRPAYQWRYSATFSDVDLAVWSIVSIVDSQAWLMTFTATPDAVQDVLQNVEGVFASVVLPD